MRIRTKLAVGFAAVSVAVMAVVILAVQALSADRMRFEDYVQGINQRAQTVALIRMAVSERAIAARNLVLLADAGEQARELATVNRTHATVGQHIARLNQLIAQAGDMPQDVRAVVADIEGIEARYAPVALGIVQLVGQQQREEAIRRMNEQCRPLLAALIAATDRYADLTRQRSQALLARGQADYSQALGLLVGAGGLAVLAAVAAGVMVTRSIVGPLLQAVRLADSVAHGDLTHHIEASSRDEVGQLLQALQRMSESLGRIVMQVRNSSDSIAVGVSQVAVGNADLSQRTERQASTLQETAATMEQLNTTVRHNADSAQQANQLAQGASAIARDGGQVVGDVVHTMQAIDQSSQRMADIIGVIDGIAFQTNILALNAAVEAARAGEAGRGFAVVASEVRALATRSAEAARGIKALIDASLERVEQGRVLAGKAGATMEEVLGSIRRVTDIVGEISHAGREQSQGVEQVGSAIMQMDQVTQQNAALVEESAAAAQSLSDQARALVQVVAQFKLQPGH